jgi:transketolase
VLQAAAAAVPWLIGGSADLAPSNNSDVKGADSIGPDAFSGRNLHFGVREHAMGAILNGMATTGLRPYGATFETFSDYMRPSVRLAALSEWPVIYLYTHDSIFLGEDGPTHQPVEQHMALRLIPHLHVHRPADGPETAMAWVMALERTAGPTALLLTRQKVAEIDRSQEGDVAGAKQGGYVLRQADSPQVVLLASGSEVGLALAVREKLSDAGVAARVVSMPCMEVFDEQPRAYQEEVLGGDAVVLRVALEAGVGRGWERYVGREGLMVTQDEFGASAPFQDLAEHFGFTAEQIMERVRECRPELFS